MRLEFHQLERRGEQLRVRRPERQRRLLASLAASGQQTPIIVVAVAEQPERYLVIDGYQRLAALEQLGRDTVEALVWPLSEAEALVLDRSLRMAERATALEEGWLLAELERRFGYGLEELARRFDRSLSWVSRRLALVELLPQSVQQQVRSGTITAHVAMKYLVPVARSRPEDCQPHGRSVGHASLHQPRSRTALCRVARRYASHPPTDSATTAVVFENAAATRTRSAGRWSRRTVARSGDGNGDHPPGQPATGRRHRRVGSSSMHRGAQQDRARAAGTPSSGRENPTLTSTGARAC